MAQAYINKNLTASSVEATIVVNGEFEVETMEINNDSLTTDLHIKLTGLYSTTSDYIIIKPAETFTVSNTKITSVMYKTLTGSVAFRLLGLNGNG